MVRIVLDAGHGLGTPGKQSPAGEKEWLFNNRVLLAAQTALLQYENVEVVRVDDPSGMADIPLRQRTDRANAQQADLYISFHHNANTGSWGDWGGVETYTMDARNANPESVRLARLIQPEIVKAMGLRDRGVKKKNLHVLRETRMPAVLMEGGFMDSRTDIAALRNSQKLQAQGRAAASAIAAYFGLVLTPQNQKPLGSSAYRLVTGTFSSRDSAEKAAELIKAAHGWTVYVKEE
ncbi:MULTISPECIES: N-acetylmuramoyl-L-alanine amidase family protein [Sporosarcina]|uniref:N-acetylmuramoyl-L-alanine amidase family protein n=1 Tax=Sporosarcina TaxID=1569 RepID=UPI0006946B36|nr:MULTISPECIES: N-acetylmuramoyl-L-alanine amidase [Sporosarcina]WJY27769.1 N-acetylmuramoyl-L-alanine amidase [Sporosarcina sp. 0.2-SM1T-5]